MNITISKIGDEYYTVIHHDTKHKPESNPERFVWYPVFDGSYNAYVHHELGNVLEPTHIATALKALPRNPTAKDAPLLYRYAAEGILAGDSEFLEHVSQHGFPECPEGKIITGATDPQGNRVEVAIKESE